MRAGVAAGRGLALLALGGLLLGLGAGGCYKPGIGEGDLICGPGGACPSGFKCLTDNRCYRNLSTPVTGGDAAVEVKPGGTPDLAAGGDGAACFRGLACSSPGPAGPMCDPVCQTGCGCDQKCGVPGTPPICMPLPAKPADLYEACGGPAGDNCRAGSICSPETAEACGRHCYRACRADDDCGPAARCTDQFFDSMGVVQTKLCSTRIEGCNPTGINAECNNAAARNRPFPTFGCYLLDAGKDDATVCDCAGTLDLGQACEARHSCRIGLECLPDAANDRRCRRLCTLPGAAVRPVVCAGTQVCRPLGPGTLYGACAGV